MAPLKTDSVQNDTLTQKETANISEATQELHPEAYKVKGPMPEKMKTVSASLRNYAHGLYGLL